MNTKQAQNFVWQVAALLSDESNYESKLKPKFEALKDHLAKRALQKEELEKQYNELWKTGLMLESQICRLRHMLDVDGKEECGS
jgi:hypothetical protein